MWVGDIFQTVGMDGTIVHQWETVEQAPRVPFGVTYADMGKTVVR